MSHHAEQLDRRILAFIDSDGAGEPFGRLAGDLFAHQYAACPHYRAYCDDLDIRPERRNAPPREPARPRARSEGYPAWLDIPAPWPIAWRLAELRCFDPARTIATFRSSGTTGPAGRGAEQGRSRHAFDTLALYRAAMARPFSDALLAGGPDRRPLLVLMPSPVEQPDSSLSFMMGAAIEQFGRPEDSGFFVHGGRLLAEEFVAAVSRAATAGQPVVLASTAFGWVALLEALRGRAVGPLPPDSRVMETGGYKGRSAQWPRAELIARLAETFGLVESAIVSEYGMCELSSQFYATPTAGQGSQSPAQAPSSRDPKGNASRIPSDAAEPPASHDGAGPAPDPPPLFTGPPWTRVAAIDPQTQRPVPPGEAGLLRIIDLANRGSCIAVQTEDLAMVADERSFRLLGRAPAAPPKGCSLTAEELLSAGRPR